MNLRLWHHVTNVLVNSNLVKDGAAKRAPTLTFATAVASASDISTLSCDKVAPQATARRCLTRNEKTVRRKLNVQWNFWCTRARASIPSATIATAQKSNPCSSTRSRAKSKPAVVASSVAKRGPCSKSTLNHASKTSAQFPSVENSKNTVAASPNKARSVVANNTDFICLQIAKPITIIRAMVIVRLISYQPPHLLHHRRSFRCWNVYTNCLSKTIHPPRASALKK